MLKTPFLPLLGRLARGPEGRSAAHVAASAAPAAVALWRAHRVFRAGPREQGENGPRQRVSDPGSDRLSTARGTHREERGAERCICGVELK